MDNDKLNKYIQKREKEAILDRMDSLKNPSKVTPQNIPLPSECKTSLEWFRKSREMTQAQLSKESGVNLRMIQHYEQGVKDISKAQAITVYKLAQALECTVEDLL